MPPYTLLLLDLDDTVVEFTRVRRDSFVRAAADFQLPVDGHELYAAFCRESGILWRGHRDGHVSLEQVRVDRFATVLRDYPVDPRAFTERFYEILSQAEEIMPGAVDAVRALRERHTLVGISNGRKEVQEERLRRIGVLDAFRFVFGPEDCGFAKPHGGLFRLALERAGVTEKGRALVVGDGLETDIQGAVDYGLDSCWLNPEGMKLGSEDPVPTFQVKDLRELAERLRA